MNNTYDVLLILPSGTGNGFKVITQMYILEILNQYHIRTYITDRRSSGVVRSRRRK